MNVVHFFVQSCKYHMCIVHVFRACKINFVFGLGGLESPLATPIGASKAGDGKAEGERMAEAREALVR